MARKKKTQNVPHAEKTGHAVPQKLSETKKTRRPKRFVVQRQLHESGSTSRPEPGHLAARNELRKKLGGYAAMLAPSRPSSRIKGQNNLIGLSVGLKHCANKSTGDLAIRVFVRKKVARSRLSKDAQVPSEINGYPTDVVEIGIPRPVSVSCGGWIHNDAINLTDGSFEAGTLGCLVVTQDGKNCLMSCNHVIANLGQARTNDPINSGGMIIARLLTAPPLTDPPGFNFVDVALAEVINGDVSQNLAGLSLAVPARAVAIGNRVRKSGAVTGVTTGTVTDFPFESSFNYTLPGIDLSNNIFVEKQYIFRDQILIKSDPDQLFCNDGDSGSIVELESTNQPVGLLFASDHQGFCFANPIQAIINTLQLTQILPLSQV
jgi:hypothetical protein